MNYITISGEANAEIEVKHSKFIAFVSQVNDVDEADSFVHLVKKKYSDARHVPYAYIVGDKGETSRCSDDGEPSGTAGQPILNVIASKGLTKIAVAIVRYFGGIKLGTGGLTRAYSDAAVSAIECAKMVNMVLCNVLKVSCSYSFASYIQTKAFSIGGKVLESTFDDGAEIVVAIPTEQKETYISAVLESTSGKAKILDVNSDFFSLV